MEFKIGNKKVGDGHPVFFIAEAGVNHNGSLKLGKQLIDVALDAGADAVKFQTFKTENIITPDAPKSTYHLETTGSDSKQTWYELLKTQDFSKKMHIELIKYCNKKKIIFLSTPYDEESADLLEDLDVQAMKIASTDTNNIPLLRHIARKGRPLLLSTAMSTMEEVTEAVQAVRDEGLEDIAVFQCTGNYPSKLEHSNLRVMLTYRDQLNCLVGYSDHTEDMINPIAATAMGANIYEKHITVDKTLPGPDHRMALDPNELKQTVKIIRDTELSLGNPEKQVLENEKENRAKLRKSIIANCDMPSNTLIDHEMISVKRPGYGMPPSMLNEIIGRRVNKNNSKYEPIKYEDLL
jgi:N,N'-diacetyllegionaminate synthase